MMDSRIEKLADILVNFSVRCQSGDNVLINGTNGTEMLITALIRAVYKAGGKPYVWYTNQELERELAKGYTKEQLETRAARDAELMRNMQCYIGFSSPNNTSEMSDIPVENINLYSSFYNKPVHGLVRVPHTRWVVLRYPTYAMAQSMAMSSEAFERFYFDVCTMDYSRMDKAMDALKNLMESTDQVHIVGKGTDLTFSIKGMPAIKCSGQMNIPDGEVYTAPVRNSVNGTVTYNTPSSQDSFTFENVCLTFRDGKIIHATANDTERVNAVFNRDEGARYVGEFAIGVNPYITKPMNNTLFDEKIMGSFHFTPGNSYDDCDNGNKSALHWDLVCIQTPEKGGGEIYFDGKLIRKDGRFVPECLQCLNPENLM